MVLLAVVVVNAVNRDVLLRRPLHLLTGVQRNDLMERILGPVSYDHVWLGNVTDRYRGSWTRVEANTATGEKNATDWVHWEERHGGIALFLHQTRVGGGGGEFNVVWADVIVRKGMFDTEDAFALRLEGLYWPARGILQGIANPRTEEQRIVENVVIEFPPDDVTPEAAARFLASLSPNITRFDATPLHHAQQNCYYVVGAQATTMQEFAEPEWKRNLQHGARRVGVASPYLYLDGFFVSPNCGDIVLNFTTKSVYIEEIKSSGSTYVVATMVITLGLLFSLSRQMQHAASTMRAIKVSRLSVVVAISIQGYVAILHCVMALFVMEGLQGPLLFLGFLELLVVFLYELRYVLRVWLSRDLYGWWSHPHFFRYFYFVGCAALLVLHFFPETAEPFLLIPFYLFWVPQIIENALQGNRHAVDWVYIVMLTVSRVFPLVYFVGYEGNFLRVAPHPKLLAAIVSLLGVQLAVLAVQDFVGFRWLHPPPYNYRPDDLARVGLAYDVESPSPQQCVICLMDISEGDLRARNFMVPPCGHVFHARCLLEWMNTKLVCPVCRLELPSVNDHDDDA